MTHEPQFIPEGCHVPSQEALTLGAGTQWQEVYEFANGLGLEVVGGADQTVGAVGGWVQVSPFLNDPQCRMQLCLTMNVNVGRWPLFSHSYARNGSRSCCTHFLKSIRTSNIPDSHRSLVQLQYKAVTTDGILRIANSCQNSDLFFALRGGGGGTFAVVLEATIMSSPSQSFRVYVYTDAF